MHEGADLDEVFARHSRALVELAAHPALSQGDEATVYRAITETAAREMPVSRVSIWFFDEDIHGLRCADLYEAASQSHSHGLTLTTADYPSYFKALSSDLSIAADDAHTDPRTKEFSTTYLQPFGIGALLDAPIRVAGKIVGVVCHEHVGGSRRWSVYEKLFCGLIADVVGLTVTQSQQRSLEAQLRHSQKLEAIGLLAGGIAHDFNNLLTAITGNASLARALLPVDSPALGCLDEIETASEFAASLTGKLLAFSRKQVLRPRPVDACAIANDLVKVLRRLVGERISLALELAGNDAWIETDPGQLEQVLLNLAINAKEAMPQGGRLDISISRRTVDEQSRRRHPNLERGEFVMLSVSDTGIGMDEPTRRRVFEPFFTTKAPGQGTGLGLSTVYGIVEQSGGSIFVDSRPGLGTRFDIALPALQRVDPVLTSESIVTSGRETILVAEDDAQVRQLLERYLHHLGYEVITAGHGRDAIDRVHALKKRVHLLVADVVMPEMNGPELARELRSQSPEMKILFMSGHSPEANLDGAFIAKPFVPSALARTVRELLDT